MCSVCFKNPCFSACPNNTQCSAPIFCPVCGSELGDETYIFKKTKEIVGCENCISTICYDRLEEI